MDEPTVPTVPSGYFGDAEYLLEIPLPCPHCRQVMQSVVIVRMLRSRVNFVSSLPRRGHAIACPACRGILSMELGGI
jgi:hypothetical protein